MPPTDQTVLFNRAIDGELSPAEQRELDALLAADSAAREDYEQFVALCATLDDNKSPVLPNNFTERVMSQLPQNDAQSLTSVVELHARKKAADKRGLSAPAWGLAASLLVAVAVVGLWDAPTSPQDSELVGTLAAPAALPWRWLALGPGGLQIDIPESGEFTLQLNADGLIVGDTPLQVESTDSGTVIRGSAPLEDLVPLRIARRTEELEVKLQINGRAYSGQLQQSPR